MKIIETKVIFLKKGAFGGVVTIVTSIIITIVVIGIGLGVGLGVGLNKNSSSSSSSSTTASNTLANVASLSSSTSGRSYLGNSQIDVTLIETAACSWLSKYSYKICTTSWSSSSPYYLSISYTLNNPSSASLTQLATAFVNTGYSSVFSSSNLPSGFTATVNSLASILAASSSSDSSTTIVTDPTVIYLKTTTGYGKGYGAAFLNNIYKIEYSTNYTYVSTNSIPAYSIGPWSNNPNNASAQSFIFRLPKTPKVTTTKVDVPLGHFGIWIDGVSMYNAWDAQSYNNLGVWQRNAYVWEGSSFDSCYGHPDGSKEYHIHVNPACLYTITNTTVNNVTTYSHSPLIGFAFDGYPVYGPYAYTSANNTASTVKLMKSSYKLRTINDRTTLSNGTVLSAQYYGPAINTTYPLGSYLQDYEYSSGLGDLDQYNGRYGITPEYPSGTYAYFVTIDSKSIPQYPFIIGPQFYGVPDFSNMGPSSGKINITESTTVYYSYS